MASLEGLKGNLSSVSFDYKEFWRILTTEPFLEKDSRRWVEKHFPLTLQISTLYVMVVFGTKYLMRNRQPFNLFVPLNAWNLFLAVFSIIGTIKLTPEFFGTLFAKGFQESYCKLGTFIEGNNGYWVWLFIVSKMFELTDTVFLVLRKRPLMFLHWYHHILTMVYAFYSYPHSPGFNRWGIYLNFFVHAFMYSYYFLRSMKVRVPGAVAKFITTLQIMQFIISVAVLVHLCFLIYVKNVPCDFDSRILVFAVFMDVTYLILFVNFFLKSYVLGGGKAKYSAVSANGKARNGHTNGVIANGNAKKHE
jgi:elongation of very long chain fatty acids protein 6